MNDSILSTPQRLLAGLLAGLIAGLLFSWWVNPPLALILNLLICAIVGLVFGLVFGPKVRSYGTGLVWGEAMGLFWWFLGSLTLIPLLSDQKLAWDLSAMEQMFPLLLGQVVAYGAVLGLSYYGLLKLLRRYTAAAPEPPKPSKPISQPIVPSGVQAVIVGGISGTIGSLFFLSGIDVGGFFPLVAGLAGSGSPELGQFLHYIIGTIIGITFGILFHRDVRQVGTGVIWGLNYGFVWWIVGPLTLMPWIMGKSASWELSASKDVAASLMAHLLYGTIVGWCYTLVNKAWHILFVDSDPLNRPEEGAGTRGVRGGLIGGAAGLIGGLLFAVVMWSGDELLGVASLIRLESSIVGLILHLFISVIIGMIYGLFFQREAATYRSGLGWGLTYGFLWWVIGTSTLIPILLGEEPPYWSLQAIVDSYPALIGHLLYGAGLGLSFPWLAQRYDTPLPQNQAHTPDRPVPALWVVTVVLGVMLPLLFSIP
ncbi:MAG: hypothetical protein ACPGWR_23420 [Ardenticatenaceae bacterium]